MLLNEIEPGTQIELVVIIGNQKLSFNETVIDFSLNDKKLEKELHKITKGYPFLVTPAITKDEKVVGFPSSGVIYQLLIGKENKLFIFQNIVVKQIKLPDQPPYHFFIGSSQGKEFNRRSRFRLWLGCSATAVIGMNKTAFDVTIKDISSVGICFLIQNRILEENPSLNLAPNSLVVLTFFDEPSGSNFRLTGIVVRVDDADAGRKSVGCKFPSEVPAIAQFVTQRQREKLRDQRK